jgi:D-mannonate dehydratase
MPLDSIEFQNSSTNHNFGFSQQDIAKAFDEAASKFMEEILEADCLDARLTATMRASTKAKATSYRDKFSKFTSVANSKLRDKFLEKV